MHKRVKPTTTAADTREIPLHLIAPLTCVRPDAVDCYVAMLGAGKKAPPVDLIKQRLRNRRYLYRIFDGAHRVRAARRAGRKMIEARIIVVE
jgi:uncharacterized ParB-like nuclease family protein